MILVYLMQFACHYYQSVFIYLLIHIYYLRWEYAHKIYMNVNIHPPTPPLFASTNPPTAPIFASSLALKNSSPEPPTYAPTYAPIFVPSSATTTGMFRLKGQQLLIIMHNYPKLLKITKGDLPGTPV